MRPRILPAALLAVGILALASDVSALANRVFVSARTGNNANSCDSILTPCQTFAGAVLQLNPGGEAIVLDSGGYGPVTITKSVTIEAPPGVTAFIHPSAGEAVTISADVNDTVVLRGLVLNGGSGNGITVNSVGRLSVEGCAISGFSSFGLEMAAAGALDVTNTDISHCFIGLEIDASGQVQASIDGCHFDGNAAGFRSETTSPGGSRITATNTTADNNSQYGWIGGAASSGTDVLNLEFCSGSGNQISGVFSSSADGASRVRYSNCTFAGNGAYGVQRLGTGAMESRGSNTITGNGIGATDGTIGSFPPL